MVIVVGEAKRTARRNCEEQAQLRILVVVTGLGVGGAETQAISLATALSRRGHIVRIVSLTSPEEVKQRVATGDLNVVSLKMKRRVADYKGFTSLIKLQRTWKPHIVHSHMVHANLLSRLAKLLHWTPVLVNTVHSEAEGGKVRYLAYRATAPLTDLVTAVSPAAAERQVREKAITQRKLRVLPNGVDTQHFKCSNSARHVIRQELRLDNRFIWLAVGRFEAAKDYPNLLKAFAKVIAIHPSTVLLIAGDGPLRKEAEQLGKDLGVSKHIRFLGVRKDVAELMSAADAFVMSSAWEGLPMVLLEAAATELVIVATDVGGNRDIVLEGESGLLISPKESEALASAMKKLMNLSEAERQRMGRTGRDHVIKNYGLNSVVDRWEALFRELYAKKVKRP